MNRSKSSILTTRREHTEGEAQSARYEYFYPREANRLILDVLREVDEPLDTGEIAKRVAEKKGYTLEELDYRRFQTYLSTSCYLAP